MPRSGTGRTYKRGETWWIDYSFRGRRFRESSDSQKRKDATDLLKKRMAEMGSGKLIGPSEGKVTFEDLASMIETDYEVNNRKSRPKLHHLRDFFGHSRALDITTDRVRRYIVHRQEMGAANATIQQELAHLKRAFNLAVQAERLSSRPHIPSVKVSNVRKGFFEPAELERVVTKLSEPLKPVVRFAALTGWRKGEVLPLQWAQVDFDAGEVRLETDTTKNDEGRTFPFRALPALAELLEEQRERTRALEREMGQIIPQVFHRNGRPIRDMNAAWRKATEDAGLGGWLFHDLRRTAVRNLEQAGVARSVAMKLTGHKTEAVYRRHAIADAKALFEGVEKLAKLHASAPKKSKVVPIAQP